MTEITCRYPSDSYASVTGLGEAGRQASFDDLGHTHHTPRFPLIKSASVAHDQGLGRYHERSNDYISKRTGSPTNTDTISHLHETIDPPLSYLSRQVSTLSYSVGTLLIDISITRLRT